MSRTATMVVAAVLAWVEGEGRIGREYSEAYIETALDADPEIAGLDEETYALSFGDAMNFLCELGVLYPTLVTASGEAIPGVRVLAVGR